MKYLKSYKIFDKYDFELSYKSNSDNRYYLFETNDNNYLASISKSHKEGYPWFGFKVKDGFFYDPSIITNDDIFGVMSTIKNIILEDNSKYNTKGYIFSFTGDKAKNNQRLKLYKRIFPNIIKEEHYYVIEL